jgi:broad specificity phosphatase PhoE
VNRSSKTTIYLLRHGRDVNPRNLIKGRLPGFPLSEKGRGDAKEAAKILKGMEIQRIYSSPLQRAHQTAQIIADELSLPGVAVLDDLNEMEAKPAGKSRKLMEGVSHRKYLQNYEHPGSIVERMQCACRQMVQENEGEAVAAVSHGWPITILKKSLRGKKIHYPERSFPQGWIAVLKLDEKLNLLEPIKTLRFTFR